MPSNNTSQIDREKLENVQRLDSLLTLIAKIMVARDIRAREAEKDKDKGDGCDGKATDKSDQI